AHQFVSQLVKASAGIAPRAHGQNNEDGERGKRCHSLPRLTPEALSLAPAHRPAPTGSAAVTTRAGAVTRAGCAFGTSATPVPAITISTPIQIHSTSGFKCARMIGLPVSSFRPLYTRYKSSRMVERLARMVAVC